MLYLSYIFPDVIEMRMREVGNKFVFTDYERAARIVQVVKGLDFVKEVFVIGDKPVEGCTPFDKLLQDSGDGKYKNIYNISYLPSYRLNRKFTKFSCI